MSSVPTFRLVGGLLKWLGLSGLALGGVGSAYALMTAVQTQTGWGLSTIERCCLTADLNKAALALLLGSMFFMLAGAGLLLISRPLIRTRGSVRMARWPTWVARALYLYSAGTVALAVIFAMELRGVARQWVAGLVAYCVLVAVGLLIASWGLKRFADTG